jgi:hypothetical protein
MFKCLLNRKKELFEFFTFLHSWLNRDIAFNSYLDVIIFIEYKVKTSPWFHGSIERFNAFKVFSDSPSGVQGVFLASKQEHAIQYARILANTGGLDTIYIYTVHLIRPLNIFDPFNSDDLKELFKHVGNRIFFEGKYISFERLCGLMQNHDNFDVMESNSMLRLTRFWEGFVSWENNMRNIVVFKPRLINSCYAGLTKTAKRIV